MPSRGTLTPLVSTGASVLYLTRWGNKTQSFLCLFLGVYYYFCSFLSFIYLLLFILFFLALSFAALEHRAFFLPRME